jgi:hypothetical protein
MAFYLVSIDKVLLVPIKLLEGKKTITFRTELPKNGQQIGINLIEDYLLDKTLCVETLHDEPKD